MIFAKFLKKKLFLLENGSKFYLVVLFYNNHGGKKMANAILAAILSFLIPGLGQAYAGDIKKGIIFFVGALILGFIFSLIFKYWVLRIINVIYALYVAYDAYQMAY